MSLLSFLLLWVIVLFSATLHEVAHGYMANKLGDATAKLAGRISFNPLVHIHLIGSIILPLMLYIVGFPIIFAVAKPVPINPYNLKDPKKDMIFIGLAGPLTNLAVAFGLAILLRIPIISKIPIVNHLLFLAMFVNLILCVFNLVPIPPLDGSRVLTGLLPDNYAYYILRLEPFGIVILFGLLWLGLFGFLFEISKSLGYLFLGDLFYEFWK
jgi:Zn-dependent protease